MNAFQKLIIRRREPDQDLGEARFWKLVELTEGLSKKDLAGLEEALHNICAARNAMRTVKSDDEREAEPVRKLEKQLKTEQKIEKVKAELGGTE